MPSVPLTMNYNQQMLQSLPRQRDLDNWDFLSTCIKIVSVDEIQGIIRFGDILNEALDRVLLRVDKLEGYRKELVTEIRERTYLIEQFRAIINTAIYVRWFNNKTLTQREKKFKIKRRLQYTESEAKRIIPLLLEYYKDPEIVHVYISLGERAYKSLNKPKYAHFLEIERKKMEKQFDIEKA